MTAPSKPRLAKLAANMRSDQKAAAELAAGLLAEPAGFVELARAAAQNANPFFWLEWQRQAAREHAKMLTGLFDSSRAAGMGDAADKGDRRFSAPEWTGNVWFQWLRDSYLINSRLQMEAIAKAELDPPMREKLEFYARVASEALSPANFPLTNPEAINAAIESRGESIATGARNLLKDMGNGYVSLTDETAFELGRNIAATPGDVIFENAVMQLIQYKPLTAKTHARPMLFVPPFVNKFYLMDLEPENSFIRWTLEQGHQLFLVSFKNAGEAERLVTWDDYVEDGVLAAMDAVLEVAGSKDMNLLGFCTGGTLAATAFAPLIARRRKSQVKSLTLLAAGIDFSDVGEIGVYMDSPFMRGRARNLRDGGVMPARDLAAAFSALKANDLVWSNVVNHYLKGKPHTPFGLLYWNSDPTNLPGPLYAWYLDHTYMGDKLIAPNETIVRGAPLDLGAIDIPVYAMGAQDDHIVPWRGAYASARCFGPRARFCLGGGGHIAGTMNPAGKNRRNYWTSDDTLQAADADAWLASAQAHKGSWWNDWAQWLRPRAGKLVAAPQFTGSKKHAPIEPAPGRYVRERSV